MDQQSIRACLGIGRSASECLGLAEPSDQCFSPRNHQPSVGETGCFDFTLKLLDGHQDLPTSRSEVAVLRKGLVLDCYRCNARCRVARHKISDIDGVAVTRIEVGDHWRILYLSDRPH